MSVAPPGDLAPGNAAVVSLTFDIGPGPFTLQLRHGLGGVPDIERQPFFVAEVLA
jgi:hypothetical protein